MSILQSLWMVFASAAFALMAACVKLASEEGASLGAIIFTRGLPSVILIWFWVLCTQRSFKTPRLRSHIARSVFGIISIWCGFYAYAHLPLATAASLNYTTTLFITFWTVLTTVLARRTLQIFAVALGFLGVMVVLRPSINAQDWFAILVGLFAGLSATGAVLTVKRLGQVGEPVWRTVFYFSVSVTFVGLIGFIAADNYVTDWHALTYLLGIGLFGLLGQLGLTRSFSYGATVLTATLQYTAIIFSALLSLFLWDTTIDLLSWLGMLVIILSGGLCAYGAKK